jgi:hypothetical protein
MKRLALIAVVGSLLLAGSAAFADDKPAAGAPAAAAPAAVASPVAAAPAPAAAAATPPAPPAA